MACHVNKFKSKIYKRLVAVEKSKNNHGRFWGEHIYSISYFLSEQKALWFSWAVVGNWEHIEKSMKSEILLFAIAWQQMVGKLKNLELIRSKLLLNWSRYHIVVKSRIGTFHQKFSYVFWGGCHLTRFWVLVLSNFFQSFQVEESYESFKTFFAFLRKV